MTVIPAERLRPLVIRYAEENGMNNRGANSTLPRRMYRVLNEIEHLSLRAADLLLRDMDMLDEWHIELADLYETDLLPERGPVGPAPFIPDSKIRHAHTLYLRGMSLFEIAELLFDSYGFANAHSCENSLKRGFVRCGYPRRTKGDAARMRYVNATCASCGCPLQKRSPGCATCVGRHHQYKTLGRPSLPAVCRGCGCGYEERTRKCMDCTTRAYRRRKQGLPYVNTRSTTCSSCDAPHAEQTPGCLTCRKRHNRWNLKLRRNELAAQRPPAARTAGNRFPAGGGLLPQSGGPNPLRGRRTPSTERKVA